MTEVLWTWPQIAAIGMLIVGGVRITGLVWKGYDLDAMATLLGFVIWLWILSAGGFWQ